MTHAVTPHSSGAVACRLTPPGEGGISLIELSGPEATSILESLFQSPRGLRVADGGPGRLLYGRLVRERVELDEVIVECAGSRGDRRYVVNCHGGPVAVRRVMAALAAEGAREAPWREAVSAAGLDAVQREAAGLLPSALTLRGVRMLLEQYGGALTVSVAEARGRAERGEREGAREILEGLLQTASYGRGLVEPATLALIGRPNVGKSTLANALLRYERMIVHAEPGTTRDAVEELLAVREIPFRLVDTAGIRETGHEIEKEGVTLSVEALRRADVVLLLLDASAPLGPEDLRLLTARSLRRIPVLTKGDLPAVVAAAEVAALAGASPVRVSATTGAGMEALEERIVAEMYPVVPVPGAAVVFTARQEQCIRDALRACEEERRDDVVRHLVRAVDSGAESGDAGGA